MTDERRTKPRMQVVLTPEGRATLERLAAERGLAMSVVIETLIRDEAARVRRAAKRAER